MARTEAYTSLAAVVSQRRGKEIPTMQYGLDVSITGAYAQASLLADLAALAEEAGWDGFFVQDGILNAATEPLVDPWIALSAIALGTRRLRLGAFMTPLAAYRPWQVARQTVAVDHLSQGRLIFGAGLGEQPEDFVRVGEDADPRQRAEKLDEGLQVLRLLWSGEVVSFQGTHYQLAEAHLLPKPLQSPSIPIWVAGYWPHHKPLRRAARFDGIYLGTQTAHGEPLSPRDLQEALAYIESQRTVTSPFDVALAGETPADVEHGVAMVHPFASAGVTWWLEGIWPERGSLEQMRERIHQGPPRRSAAPPRTSSSTVHEA
jgi:alkanesulfonate monooxygenase SsuD/methylene tetrahydromethanopterin reductase-like flavin-dependent oxidoreductase (luciferase family)